MRLLLNWIAEKRWSEALKFKIIVLICTATAAAAGLGVWSIVRLWTLDHWSWMLVFAGYPAFIALVLIIIYSFNHSFHNEAHEKDRP